MTSRRTEPAAALALPLALALFAGSVRGRPLPVPVAYVALALAAGLGYCACRTPEGMTMALGRLGSRRRALVWLGLGTLTGVLLAVLWRRSGGLSGLPARLTPFAAVAAAIGATEEVVFRGLVQGRLRVWGQAAAVLGAAVLHTAYKVAVLASPPAGYQVNLGFLATWTLLGGLLFGIFRAAGGSVWPCVAAHAAFDVVGYGDWSGAPWWVWG
ncbi:MAG: CPBP family intramembrane metalloprotease [Lentisphaeria bacterium]|nr:CPBP family intramembrane metalloprotease [Lentisphaeria bacterium]